MSRLGLNRMVYIATYLTLEGKMWERCSNCWTNRSTVTEFKKESFYLFDYTVSKVIFLNYFILTGSTRGFAIETRAMQYTYIFKRKLYCFHKVRILTAPMD